jgi:hypothetical protein
VFYKPILLTSVCFALLASGCSDDDDHDEGRPLPPIGTGTLQFSWTIDGLSDLAACEAVAATAFEIQVFDEGYFVNGAQAPCDAFETSVELYVDDYVSRVTLVDVDGYAVTRRVVEDYFLIEEGQVTRLAVDFPTGAPGAEPDAGVVPPADAGVVVPTPTEPDPTSGADAGADAAVP